jgi:hypothetical protein
MGKLTTTKRADLAPIATTPHLLASLADHFDLPSDDANWKSTYAAAVGHHPPEVLALASQIIVATRQFTTFPQPAETIAAILNAYSKLGVPMSPDAIRLQDLRQSSDRYVAGADGRRRFLSGLKLGLVQFHALTGHHGNQVLNDVPIATVEAVERAVLDIGKAVANKDEIALGTAIDLVAQRADELAAVEQFDRVDAQCGGPVAELGEIEFRSRWVCLSQQFIIGVIARHPELRMQFDPFADYRTPIREPSDLEAWRRLERLFREMASGTSDRYGQTARVQPNPRTYGRGLQADFEKQFNVAVAEMIPDIKLSVERRKAQHETMAAA